MKLHILSDLHLEFGKWSHPQSINDIEADVTILAGDIATGLEGLAWAQRIYRPVIYVMGNHEFYGQRPMNKLWDKARAKVAGTQVHLLENDSILIQDPNSPGNFIRFIGATLWTDFCLMGEPMQAPCMAAAAKAMSDYKTIFLSRRGSRMTEYGMNEKRIGDLLTPAHTLAFHQESIAFLETELGRAPALANNLGHWAKTVVVTHHAPAIKSLGKTMSTSLSNAAYASHLDHLVAEADLWVHGHTHVATDYELAPGIGRVVSNPRGYVGHSLVREFDPALVIEI